MVKVNQNVLTKKERELLDSAKAAIRESIKVYLAYPTEELKQILVISPMPEVQTAIKIILKDREGSTIEDNDFDCGFCRSENWEQTQRGEGGMEHYVTIRPCGSCLAPRFKGNI